MPVYLDDAAAAGGEDGAAANGRRHMGRGYKCTRTGTGKIRRGGLTHGSLEGSFGPSLLPFFKKPLRRNWQARVASSQGVETATKRAKSGDGGRHHERMQALLERAFTGGTSASRLSQGANTT